MAYPIVSGPYGLHPTTLIGGRPYAGSVRMIPIASGYNTALYYGDPVKFTSDGTLIQSAIAYNTAATETGGTLGIFLGCEYSPSGGPLYGKLRAQKWTAGTVASDAVAYVADDPGVLMRTAIIAYNSGSTPVMGCVPANAMGTNLSSMAASTANDGTLANLVGNSNIGLMLASGNVRRTTTTPFRIVDVVDETMLTVSGTGTTSSGSTAVTLAAADANIRTGMLVTGTGIAANTVVAAISGTSLTLSANATASGTVTLTMVGFQEALVKWNFGYHAYENAVGI